MAAENLNKSSRTDLFRQSLKRDYKLKFFVKLYIANKPIWVNHTRLYTNYAMF